MGANFGEREDAEIAGWVQKTHPKKASVVGRVGFRSASDKAAKVSICAVFGGGWVDCWGWLGY